MPDLAVFNAGELVTCAGTGGTPEEVLGIIEGGALLVEGGKVVWTGTTGELRRKGVKPKRAIDAMGGLVTPGFVDPHTHLVFAGSREDELDRKIRGESYKQILDSGGGIARTIRETRGAGIAKVVRESSERLAHLLKNGVTTAEVKTGYGQNLEGELELLDAIAKLRRASAIELVPTFLGLHARPPEFRDGASYAEYATRKMLPEIAASGMMPRFSDCFCEEGVFSRAQCSKYLRASKALGFERKIHADEFEDSGGASLAAEAGCASADHLGRSGHEGVVAMARKGVVAVLLPGTSLFSRIPYADAKGISEAGCKVALGTDLSPNSWVESPQLVMSLACSAMRITPAEALLGFTRNAALAILRPDLGRLAPGAPADFVVHSMAGYRFLPYRIGGRYVQTVVKSGKVVFS